MIITTNGKTYCFKAFWKVKSAFYGLKREMSEIWGILTENEWLGYILGGIIFFIISVPTAIVCFIKDYFETVIEFNKCKKEYKQCGTFLGNSIDFAIERLLKAEYIKEMEGNNDERNEKKT